MKDHPLPPKNGPSRRKQLLTILSVIFLFVAASYGVYWFLHGRNHQTTDDAYVTGNLIRITPRIGGTVIAVMADDTNQVRQGQVLVRLDETDAKLALDKAEADLAETVRTISKSFQTRTQQSANLAVKQRAFEQSVIDFERRQKAAALLAISKEEADHAQAARDQAKSEMQLARAQLAAANAEVAGTSVANHPAVKQAEARLREAWLTLRRCVIRAPEDGQVAKRSVQVGQQVSAGNALMALVPMTQLWVEANFKEDQLRNMKIGQPVKLVSDLYGSNVTFTGTVVGLSPGTGSVFSLLPAQNASGNWIKIVQRLPVRIQLDPEELTAHPLRVGLSMKVEVKTSVTEQVHPASPPHYQTPVFEDDLQGVEERIEAIIGANLSGKN